MATLIPQQQQPQPSNVEATYEDMFKEITRKLYGEETGNGLHTLGTPVAQVATSGPTAAPEGEQRSFTNLQQIDRSSAPTIEYEHNTAAVAVAAAAAAAAAGNNNSGNNNAGVGTATTAAVAAAAAAAAVAQVQQQQQQNVVIQSQQQQGDGSSTVVVATTANTAAGTSAATFKSEDHLSTAFGLAALMQNGFATAAATTSGAILSTQALNKAVNNAQQQQQQNANDQRWSSDAGGGGGTSVDQQQQQPQIVQWSTGGKLQSYAASTQQQPQQQITTPKSKTKNRQEQHNSGDVIYATPSTSTQNLIQTATPTSTATNAQNTGNSGGSNNSTGGGSTGINSNSRKKTSNQQHNSNNTNNSGIQIQKRYACTHCPYSTDRRDLYTRHENIHKDEKPFQCYACLKQFNRADHVKKHFLRMHRELQYDINKTRRHLPSSGSSHAGGRGNVTISNAANVTIDNAFLESQRQPTSSSLSIVETIEAVASAADEPLPQLKQEKLDDTSMPVLNNNINTNNAGNIKPKREKRFTCCYCPWSGADKWGLKRHLNTHTKPFVCLLCDYKAARSERLATHVLKVHNKRACNKCSYLADTQEEYQAHLSEVHPHDNRPSRSSNNTNTNNNSTNINVLRTIGNTLVTNNQLHTFQNAGNAFGVGNNTTTTTTNAVGNAGGSVTIYTTTTTNDGAAGSTGGGPSGGGGNITGGPLQEIIVNPTSMVGWRLSANGSLIPPHDLLTGNLPNAATQKRGSERLFQYLEADGSDPEDYARLLKMDAISRNTASVAQDFHKAGGVHELKIPANHQLLFNNKLPSQWTTREAAALLHSLSNMSHNALQVQQQRMRARQHSTGEDDENTPSSASSSSNSSSDECTSPMKISRLQQHQQQNQQYKQQQEHVAVTNIPTTSEQHKAMTTIATAFLEAAYEQNAIELLASKRKYHQQQQQQQFQSTIIDVDGLREIVNDENQENQVQIIKSSPAYKLNFSQSYNNNKPRNNKNHRNAGVNTSANININNNNFSNVGHRLVDKENNIEAIPTPTPFLTQMEYQNLNKIGTQFQNYVKDIISKYYAAETPTALLLPEMPTPITTAQQNQQQFQQQQQHQLSNSASPAKRKRFMSETEEYIEYLRNKEDITLTITPKTPTVQYNNKQLVFKRQQDMSSIKRQNSKEMAVPIASQVTEAKVSAVSNNNNTRKTLNQLATLLPLLADAASKQQYLTTAPLDFSKKASSDTPLVGDVNTLSNDKRPARKQAQPKKIRASPEAVVAMLRDKYLNRLVHRKHNCSLCSANQRSTMLIFSYHTKGSLSLHRYWKHSGKQRYRKILKERQRQASGILQTAGGKLKP